MVLIMQGTDKKVKEIWHNKFIQLTRINLVTFSKVCDPAADDGFRSV
jgi:hypothetical protein